MLISAPAYCSLSLMVIFYPLAPLPPPSPGCGLSHGGVQVQDTTGILEEVSWTLTAVACGWVGGQRQREEEGHAREPSWFWCSSVCLSHGFLCGFHFSLFAWIQGCLGCVLM